MTGEDLKSLESMETERDLFGNDYGCAYLPETAEEAECSLSDETPEQPEAEGLEPQDGESLNTGRSGGLFDDQADSDSESGENLEPEQSVWDSLNHHEMSEDDPAESVGKPQAVPVRMFDYDYNIMSDKPRLVEILAAAIDREARQMKAANGLFNRGTFNWPVQVAFKMALDHYYTQRELSECRRELEECRQALNDLEGRVEKEAARMAELIEAGLGESD